MSLDGITQITPAIWNSHRAELVALAISGLEQVNTSEQAGEAISLQSAQLARYFVNASQKHNADLIHQAMIWTVTEGRHQWKGYSACADLCHCVLDLLGERDNRLVNRDDKNFDGTIDADEKRAGWIVELNIAKLVQGSKTIGREKNRQVFVPGTANDRPEIGDIVWIGGPAGGGFDHVFIVHHWENDLLVSTDAGQVDEGGQCVLERKRQWIIKGTQPWLRATTNSGVPAAGLGERGVNGWISVSALWDCFTEMGWRIPEDSTS